MQRKFATFLTVLSVTIGMSMVVSIYVLKQAALNGFTVSQTGIDLVVGPKGDPLSLVLQGVYHKGQPQGTLPLWFYDEMKKHPAVSYAIPVSLGDSYAGCRVVGTSGEIFTKYEYITGKKFKFSSGGPFTEDFQGVIGASVAKLQDIHVGDKIQYSCGLSEGTADEHAHELTVVGILKPTYTPSDWLIYVSYQSYIHLHEKHDHSEHEHQNTHEKDAHHEKGQEHDKHDTCDINGHDDHKSHKEKHVVCAHDEKENNKAHPESSHGAKVVGITDGKHDARKVSLLLVKAKSNLGVVQLHRRINDGQIATAAIPSAEIRNLFEIVGGVTLALHALSALVIIVAAIGIMVAIYNSISERTHDIAVMRALGASRRTIEDMVLAESGLTCFVGGVLGIFMGYGIVLLTAPLVTRYTNTNIMLNLSDLFAPIHSTFRLPLIIAYGLGLFLLALLVMLAGVLPAKKAYKIDVAGNLAGMR